MVLIKKRNFKPYILDWLTTKLELGLGIGKIRYLATSGGEYEANLKDDGVPTSEIFTSLVAAEDVLTADKNDVLLVTPGLYTETATTDWDKSHTHIVGLAGPATWSRVGKPNCMLYLDTASIDYILDISGNDCQFHNIATQSGVLLGSANATTLAPVRVTGYGNYFSRVLFKGIHSAAQLGATACSSLEIGGDASYSRFEDCIIGQNGWGGVRTTALQGHLIFTSTSTPSPQNGVFRRCLFLDRTDTSALSTVMIKTYGGIDRLWLFEDCHFDNWSTNYAATAGYVFQNAVMVQSANIRMKNCSASGYDAWEAGQHGGKWVMGNMAITGTGGGLVRALTGAAGA